MKVLLCGIHSMVLTNASCHVPAVPVSWKKVSLPGKYALLHFSFFLHPMPNNHWSFYCLYSCVFFMMSCSWNHTVCSLFRLAVSNQQYAFTIPMWLFMALVVCYFKHWRVTILSYGCITVCLFIHVKGHLGCFQVLVIMNKASINVCMYFFCVYICFQLI